MGFFDSLLKGMQDFAESPAAKRMMERAEQAKAAEISRTTGINGLRCTIDSLNNIGGSVSCCEGTVKNIGRSTYREVVVSIVYKNEDGECIDKSSCYVLTGTELYPGESKQFKTYSSARNVHSARASIDRCVEN